MPRPRLPGNKGLPPGWFQRHGAYYFAVPPSVRHHWDGKAQFRLGRTLPEAHLTYSRRLRGEGDGAHGRTLDDVIDRYLREETPGKAPASQDNDKYAASMLRPVFGGATLAEPFQPAWAYRYVDSRANPHTGKKSPSQGRKEISVLSSMLTAAVRWGWLSANPLIGQLRFKGSNKPRRYVTDDEFIQAVLLAPAWLQCYLWLKLAIGIRQSDMWALTVGDVRDTDAGMEIHVTPQKTRNSTQKRLIFELDPMTAAEVERVAGGRLDPSAPLFVTERGNPWVKSSFQSAWDRLQARIVAAGGRKFTEHDVRGKVGSDAATVESARRRLGHATAAVTMRHYRRAAERIKLGE